MAIGLPNNGTATTTAAATTSSVPFPTTTHKGALLTLAINLTAAAASCTTPAGWTLIGTQGGTGATLAPTIFAFYKYADGTEGGTSLTVTHGSVANEAQIVEWPGVDGQTALDVAAVLTDDSTSGTTTVLNTITPVTNGCTLVYWAGTNTVTQTGTQPGGWTELSDGGGSIANMESAYIQAQGTSATGGTITWSGSGKQVAILVALRPDLTVPVSSHRRSWAPPFARAWFTTPIAPPSVAAAAPPQPATTRRARLVRTARRSAFVIPATVATPTTQALPPQPPGRRRTWLSRRRSSASAVPAPVALAPPPDSGRPRHAVAPRPRRGATALPITLPLLTGDASSFEASQGAWTASTGSPTLATSATQHFTGTQSLKATATATGTLAVASPSVSGIGPGFYLRIHAWVYCETNARTLLLQVNWKTAGGGNAGFTSSGSVGGTLGGWTQVTFSGFVPSTPGITGLSLLVLATSVAISDVFYVDDADVEVVSFTAPSFTPQWWNQVTRRKVQMPPRRGRGTQVVGPGAPVVTTQALPPQGARRLVPWRPARRGAGAQVPRPGAVVATTQALPAQGLRRLVPWRPLRRSEVAAPVPTLVPAPPLLARARRVVPPPRHRRRLAEAPRRVATPPPLVARRRHAAPARTLRRRIGDALGQALATAPIVGGRMGLGTATRAGMNHDTQPGGGMNHDTQPTGGMGLND